MNIQITFSFEKEVDGVEGYVTHNRKDVEDLYEVAQMLTDASPWCWLLVCGQHWVREGQR
jgi:hypothetical protein